MPLQKGRGEAWSGGSALLGMCCRYLCIGRDVHLRVDNVSARTLVRDGCRADGAWLALCSAAWAEHRLTAVSIAVHVGGIRDLSRVIFVSCRLVSLIVTRSFCADFMRLIFSYGPYASSAIAGQSLCRTFRRASLVVQHL